MARRSGVRPRCFGGSRSSIEAKRQRSLTPRSRRRMARGLPDLVGRQRVERMRRHGRPSPAGRHRLAPHGQAGVAVAAEDDRRPARAVVVVGQRVAVGAGDRHHEQVADLRGRQLDAALEHVAALAVVADQLAGLRLALAVEDLGREALAVEHRLEVVAHAAVHGDVGEAAALDGDHLVERDAASGRPRCGRARRSASPRGRGARAARGRWRRRSRRRRRALAGPVRDPEAAAEVVDAGSCRARRAPRPRGRSRRGRAAASRCARAGRAARAPAMPRSDPAARAPPRARRRTWPPGCRCPSPRGSGRAPPG